MTTSGLGYNNFETGDILYASEVNNYLMNQSVMVFTNDGTRSSALAAPGDGQASSLTGSKVVQIYKTGTGWVTIGLQSEIRDAQIMTYMQVV